MKKVFAILGAIITLGFGGALMAQQIGSVSGGYVEEGNLVRAGNIIQTITMSNRGQDASTCRKVCSGDANCYAYTYQRTAPNRKPVCHLRMIALPSGATRNHGFTKAVSGTKLSFIPDVLKMKPYPGRALQGGKLSRKVGMANQDPIACAKLCKDDGNCQAFTYLPRTASPAKSGPACNLYSQAGSLTSRTQAGYLSGSKSKLTIPGKTGRSQLDKKPKASTPVLRRPTRQLTPRNPGTMTVPGGAKPLPDATLSDDDDVEGEAPDNFPGEMLDPPE